MTHGDQAKAKAEKSSKPSVEKAGAGKGSKERQGKAASEPSTSKKSGAGKAAAPQKAAASSKAGGGVKESAARAESKSKGSVHDSGSNGTFNNPVISSAFEQAVQKYPNAFRKLTD